MFCNFIVSPLNTNLLFCEYCKTVIEAKNYNNQTFCPVLLEQGAKNNTIKYLGRESPVDLADIQQKLSTHITQQDIHHESDSQCSQEEIDSRMNICNGFQNNSCLQCGCALSRDKNYMNKLFWKKQSCPIGKWGPVNS